MECTPSNFDSKKSTSITDYQEVKITRIKFNFDQLFEIKEIKKGQSISEIRVSGIGFQSRSKTLVFELCYPVEYFQVADIDSDGFEELYILTRSSGSACFGKIIGITSNKGKSYKTIYIPEYDTTITTPFEYLEGYMGHDSIYIQNNLLCREFPVYKIADCNAKPTGGKRKIIYKLVEYNNSFSLQISTFQMID